MGDEEKALLQEIRDELKGQHGKSWYGRTPFKEVITHSSVILVATSVGWLMHAATGGAVNIEVASAKSVSLPASAVAGAPAEIAQVTSFEDASVFMAPLASAVASAAPTPLSKTPKVVRQHWKVEGDVADPVRTAIAMASAAPASAPAPSASAPAPAAAPVKADSF